MCNVLTAVKKRPSRRSLFFLTIFPSCPPTYILVVASKARGRYELEEHWVDRSTVSCIGTALKSIFQCTEWSSA